MSRKVNPQAFLKPLACLALVLLAACSPYVYSDVGLEVGGPPPGIRAEVALSSPGPGYDWVPGYWDWSTVSADWTWVPGSWLAPPHRHARWVSPRYENRRGHWRYHRGHWQ